MTDKAVYKMFLEASEQGFDYCPKCAIFKKCNEGIKNGGELPDLKTCFENVMKGYETEARKAD